jgi:hypothetical protein
MQCIWQARALRPNADGAIAQPVSHAACTDNADVHMYHIELQQQSRSAAD